MSQGVRVVTCYVLRKRHGSIFGGSKTIYQVWIVIEVLPIGEDAVSEPVTDPVLDADAAEKLRERLREAVAEVVAGRAEGAVWKTDGSEEQVADLIADLPDVVKTLVQAPLDSLAVGAGVPAPMAGIGAEVSATLVLKPVLEPVENALHALEVAVIVFGSMTGLLHPLVITCVKHLARDELGSVLANTIKQIMKPSDAQALDDKPSTASRSGAESSQMKSSTAAAEAVAEEQTAEQRGLEIGPERSRALRGSATASSQPSTPSFTTVPALTSSEHQASDINSAENYDGLAMLRATLEDDADDNPPISEITTDEENEATSAHDDLDAM